MKEKLTWILLYGGISWGVCFACIIYVLREIQDKPVAFGSFPVLLTVSILAGMCWGAFMSKFPLNEKQEKWPTLIKNMSKILCIWIVIFAIYGLILKSILIPLNYLDTWIGSIVGWGFWGIAMYCGMRIGEAKSKVV